MTPARGGLDPLGVLLACGAVGRGVAPAGASRGSREAIELRDGG